MRISHLFQLRDGQIKICELGLADHIRKDIFNDEKINFLDL